MVYRQQSLRRVSASTRQPERHQALAWGTCLAVGCATVLSLGCESGGASARTDTNTEGTSSATSGNEGASSQGVISSTYDTAYDTAPLFTAQPPAPSATIADESTEPDVSDAPLQTCVPATGAGQNLSIDDFEDEDLNLPQQEGRLGQWYTYEEVSGDHQLTIGQMESPRLESHVAAHTSGSDHGYWAGFGVQLSDCVYDSSRYVGLHFWIRGTSNPIKVAVLTPGVVPVSNGGTCTKEEDGGCWDAYRREVDVTEEWREYFLPFSEFEQGGYGEDAGPLDLTRVRTVEFQSDAGAFEYWVDDFSFYIEEVYTPLDPSTDDTGSTDTGSADTSTVDTGSTDTSSISNDSISSAESSAGSDSGDGSSTDSTQAPETTQPLADGGVQ